MSDYCEKCLTMIDPLGRCACPTQAKAASELAPPGLLDAWRKIEAQCSSYQDGTRWCDFCGRRCHPSDNGNHKPECPIKIVRDFIANDAEQKERIAELEKDKVRLDAAEKYIGNIDLYVKPVEGMMISRPMICVGSNLRSCLSKIGAAMKETK